MLRTNLNTLLFWSNSRHSKLPQVSEYGPFDLSQMQRVYTQKRKSFEKLLLEMSQRRFPAKIVPQNFAYRDATADRAPP
jgi:hypothetical protein